VIRLTVMLYIRPCQSKIEYSARMPDPNFPTIDFPRSFGPDPGGSTAISGIQTFALTMPANWFPRTEDDHLDIDQSSVIALPWLPVPSKLLQ
jgi:hypothetical protein